MRTGPALRAERLLLLAVALSALAVAYGSARLWDAMARHRAAADEMLQDHASYIGSNLGRGMYAVLWTGVKTALAAYRAERAERVSPATADIVARVARVALSDDTPRWTPRRFLRHEGGTWSATTPLPPDDPLPALLGARIAAGIPPQTSFVAVVVPRAGDTTIAFAEPDGAAWNAFELPLAALRADVLAPSIASLDAIFRRLVDSLRVRHAAAARPVGLRVLAPAPGGGTLELLRDGPVAPTPWRSTIPLFLSLDGRLEVTLTADAIPVLMPRGYPPAPALPVAVAAAVAAAVVAVLAFAAWRALALARARTDFASTVTHELRTPLTQIQLFAETLLLDRARGPDQRRAAIEAIVRETRRLVQMVENVLAVSRLDRPSGRPARRPVLLSRVLGEVLESFEPLFRQRDVHAAVRQSGPDHVVTDEDAVRRILINLVDNAVRHAPESRTVTVEVAAAATRLELAVADDGPGVPAGVRERIWRPFERGERTGGSGIGLAVVARLAEMQGGTARVEDAPGGGARFVVDLPLDTNGEGRG